MRRATWCNTEGTTGQPLTTTDVFLDSTLGSKSDIISFGDEDGIYTHFHLDSFSGRQGRSLSDLESSISEPLLVSIPFAIANSVFPDKWSHLSEKVRADPRLGITLSVHPHMITESQVTSLFGRLEGLLGQYPG